MFWMNFADSAPEGEQPPQGDHHGDDVSVAHEANDILTKVMPYGVSLLLHVGLLLVIAFATVSMAPEEPTEKEQVIIPISTLSSLPGTPVVVSSPTSAQQMATSAVSTSTSTSRSLNASESTNTSSMANSTATGSGSGSGSTSGGGSGASGGAIFGLASGGGGGGGGGTTLFGGGVGGSSGLATTFFGTGGNAVRIVYLIDASGTLISTLPFVISELKRSINELSEKQEFAVIFFQGNDPKEVPPYGMKKVSSDSKTKVFNWIDNSGRVIPQGGNNPVKAIQLALSYRPQLIYILSDNITGEGVYQVDQRTFVQEVIKANKNGTKINTIQFLQPDPLVAYGKKPTLKEISDQTGGIYKYLDAKELGIE